LVFFHQEDISYRLRHKRALSTWIRNAVEKEGLKVKAINIVLTSDGFLFKMNQKYLNHSTLTDVITFPFENPDGVAGDVYLSLERVRENAKAYEVKLIDELHRVMIHGTLHLCGYQDGTPTAKAIMRSTEDKYLSLRSFP